MVYHLKNAISLRDYIASDMPTALDIITTTFGNAHIQRHHSLTQAKLVEAITPCGTPTSPEGVEKCMVLNSDKLIANLLVDYTSAPATIDKFLTELDNSIEIADKSIYHRHEL